MDKNEFGMFAMALKTYYPREGLLPNKAAMELWYKHLNDIDFKLAEAFLDSWVSNEKWPPTISEVRKGCFGILHGADTHWSEAWENAIKAISKYGYMNPKEAMESLDEITRECVKRIGYQDLCMAEAKDMSYFQTRFKEIFENISEQKKTEQMLSKSLADRIDELHTQDKPRLSSGGLND